MWLRTGKQEKVNKCCKVLIYKLGSRLSEKCKIAQNLGFVATYVSLALFSSLHLSFIKNVKTILRSKAILVTGMISFWGHENGKLWWWLHNSATILNATETYVHFTQVKCMAFELYISQLSSLKINWLWVDHTLLIHDLTLGGNN